MIKIGVIGSGELTRMLSIAGKYLGLEFHCLGNLGDCAEEVVKSITNIKLLKINDIISWAKQFNVITIENKTISYKIVKKISNKVNIYPSTEFLAIFQDRLLEKYFIKKNKINTVKFTNINSLHSLKSIIKKYGLPAILKTRRFKYKIKNKFIIKSNNDIKKAWNTLYNISKNLIYEDFINFNYEISQICISDLKGNIVFYPLSKNIYKFGIFIRSEAPFINILFSNKAQEIAKIIIKKFSYVGTLVIKFFIKNNNLIFNKIVPFVDSTGNWTIDGSLTSQFENHIRAITGLSLGDTTSHKTVMLNCIGSMPNIKDLSFLDRIKIYNYNKVSNQRSKVGHLNINLNDNIAKYQLLQAKKLIALSEII